MEQSINQIISNHFYHIVKHPTSVYFKPDIPEKKIKGAINSYAKNVLEENVMALYDSTVFGSAKEGCLVTNIGFYIKETADNPIVINFKNLNSVTKFSKDKQKALKIVFDGDSEEITDEGTFNIDKLYEFLNVILKFKEVNDIDGTDKLIIVEDMPVEVKINYMRILINMVFHDDGKIDDDELSELQILMTQLNFDPESRQLIRSYISEPNQETDDIIKDMDDVVPKGTENAFHISLVKDMIRIHRATKKDLSITRNYSIMHVANQYGISDEQLDVLITACKNDEMIVDGKIDDNKIIENSKNLAAQAGAVGIPIAAIYLSGSVVGLSAAGITSGLAALGLGGILGLSSMVTGIGVLLVAGVGTYHGIKWITGGRRKRDQYSKRDFMIQEIIKINQTTICNLAQDINYFGLKIVEITKEVEIDKKLIEKLGKEMTIFSQAIDKLQNRGKTLGDITDEAA